jgi:hypothetical protein
MLVENEMQSLREEISHIRQGQAASGRQSAPNHATDNLFPGSGQEEVLARLKVVETRGTTGLTLNHGGTIFTSEADLKAYIRPHEIPSCAMYWDLFSIIVCMGSEGLTRKERSNRIYSAEEGRTGSALEGELVASMSHKHPLCLYGEGTKLACLDEGFAMCKT